MGPNRGMFLKLNGPGHLGSKGYPHTSFSSGKFPDTYKSFQIGVVPPSDNKRKSNKTDCFKIGDSVEAVLARMSGDFTRSEFVVGKDQ